MATPEGTATSNGGPSSKLPNPRPNKRGACDRCRGQKLRCLRDDQSRDSSQAPCVRCFKAGAICSYGIPKRAGRPPATHVSHAHVPSSQQQTKRNRGKKTKGSGIASRSILNTNGHHLTNFSNCQANGGRLRRGTDGQASGRLFQETKKDTPDQESEEETDFLETSPVGELSPSPLQITTTHLGGANFHFPVYFESANATLPWPDGNLSTFYNNDAGQTLGLEPFGPKYSWASRSYQAQGMDIQMPAVLPMSNDAQSKDMGTHVYGTTAQTYSTNGQMSGASDEAIDIDFLSSNAHTELFSPMETVQARPDLVRDSDRSRAAANEVGENSDEGTLSFNVLIPMNVRAV